METTLHVVVIATMSTWLSKYSNTEYIYVQKEKQQYKTSNVLEMQVI
jgi:hypothetical protein